MAKDGTSNHFIDLIQDWNHKYYYAVGGYGSSKSYNIALKLILKAIKEKRKILVVREVYATLKDSCFSLLIEILDNIGFEGRYTYTTTPLKITFCNGSEFIFRGTDKPEKLKSINGISIVWMEEASEVKYSAFKELVGRLRMPKVSLHILLSQNPVSKSNWSYKHFMTSNRIDEHEFYRDKIIKRDDVYFHHSTVDDNKFVSEEYVRQLERMKEYDPDLYRIARKGQFGVLGEKLFKTIHEMKHDEVMQNVNKLPLGDRYDGLDFGFSVSYNALVRCAVDRINNQLYIYTEWHEKDLINSEVTNKVAELLNGKYHSVIADNARPELIEEIKRKGIRITKTKKVANNKVIGANKIKSFYKVIISDECSQCFKDLSELTFKKDKNDEIIENEFSFDSHVFDALAYALEKYTETKLKHGRISRGGI